MTPLSARRLPVAFLALVSFVACGGGEPDTREPAPRALDGAPSGRAEEPLLPGQTATAEEPAVAVPPDPRLVLFDVKTALEAVRPTQDGYPVPEAFRYEERWRIHRQRLDVTFDGWDYASDGQSFTLRGVIGERGYHVSGP